MKANESSGPRWRTPCPLPWCCAQAANSSFWTYLSTSGCNWADGAGSSSGHFIASFPTAMVRWSSLGSKLFVVHRYFQRGPAQPYVWSSFSTIPALIQMYYDREGWFRNPPAQQSSFPVYCCQLILRASSKFSMTVTDLPVSATYLVFPWSILFMNKKSK